METKLWAAHLGWGLKTTRSPSRADISSSLWHRGRSRGRAGQADFSAVAFPHAAAPWFLAVPQEPVHVPPSVPSSRVSRGSRVGVQVGAAPAPGDLSQKAERTSSQCPLQEESRPFSPNFGAFQEDSEQRDGVCHPWLAVSPVRTGTGRPICPSPGLTEKKPFCT